MSLEALIREIVREELSKSTVDEWVPHTRWPVQSARVACALARSGEIDARRAGRLWLARRSEIDRWVESHRAKSPAPSATKASNDYDPEASTRGAADRRRKSA